MVGTGNSLDKNMFQKQESLAKLFEIKVVGYSA